MTAAQRHALLQLGRQAVAACLAKDVPPPRPPDPAFRQRQGVFATWLTAEHELRGCIGFPVARDPLVDAVPRAAIEAATTDPRFAPVTPRELPSLRLELSLLSAPVLVNGPSDVRPGEHGLIIEQGGHVGLLLPQVAADYGWDSQTFVEQTCLKAGLSPDAWRRGVNLSVFTAEVFGEGDASR